MSIQIQAKNDYSYLFTGLGTQASNTTGSNWLADYASIKNGSYAKLMKAYYAMDSSSEGSSLAKKDTGFADQAEKKALAKVETTTDALKESADTLLATGKDSVFALQDVTTQDKNGVETTAKTYDVDGIYKAVNSFVQDYNAVVKAVNDTDSETVNQRTESLLNATLANHKLLNKIGITIQEDGTLSLDKDTFSKADMSTVKTLFQGNGSYGYRVSAQSSLINFAADHATSGSGIYTTNGTYSSAFGAGNLFSSYL